GSVYFLYKWLQTVSPSMPTTKGALEATCTGSPYCPDGYIARLSPALDQLLFGTYIPGAQASAKLHTDGSIYFSGTAAAGFPVTPGAYQSTPSGGYDAVIARLDPNGTKLIFGTYLGGSTTDWILRMAVAPDGSVWAAVDSFTDCCVNIQHHV